MLEGTIRDMEMVLVKIAPDGPVDGVPEWTVLSGQGTLLSDPSHPLWDASLPEGYQIFLVSDTLPSGEAGPVDTRYQVSADVDMGSGVQTLTDEILLHVVNQTTSLGLSASMPTTKP